MIPSYPKDRKKVTLPTRHDPGRGRPQEFLAYMTPDEMEMLRRITDGRVEIGPNGIPSFADDSASSKGVSRGDSSGTKGSGSSPSGSGTKSNTSSGGSYGGGGKMGSSSTQSGGTKSNNSNPSGSKQNGGGPGGGMMGGSLSGGPSRTSPSSGNPSGSGNGGGDRGNLGIAGVPGGVNKQGGPQAPKGGSGGTGGSRGSDLGVAGVPGGISRLGGPQAPKGSSDVVRGALSDTSNRPKNPSGPFGAPAYSGQYNPKTGRYGIDDGGQMVNRVGMGDLGQVVNGMAKTDMEQSVNRAAKADYGGYTTQAFGKTDMDQYANRADKADMAQTVDRTGKADIAQTVNRAGMGDLGVPMKGDLPAGVSYTAAAPSGVFGPRAQPPGTGYLNDLSHIGNPPSLAGPLQSNPNPNPYARVNPETQTVGFRSPKSNLQRTADIFDGPASKRPVSAAAPPPTVTRETARAPKTRGIDPYNVTPAQGGPLVDRNQFSTDYNPLSSVQAPTQRVNTAAKSDLPGRSTYGGYSFDPGSALQAAAVDNGLVGSIEASYGIDPSPVRPAAPQAVNSYKAQAVPNEALPGSQIDENNIPRVTADGRVITPASDAPLEIDIPGYPDQRRAGVTGGLGVTGVNSGAPGAQKLDGGNMSTKGRDKFYGGGPGSPRSADSSSEPGISGPDVPPSESPSQEGWWGGPSGDVAPSQREPLIDKKSWPNRIFDGATRLLDVALPGAATVIRTGKNWDIDNINQMSPAEQAALKERWDRERDAYLRGDIGAGRGGDRRSALASLVGGNAYIPPGAIPMPDPDPVASPLPATPPDPWKRRRVGSPDDPYTYGYGPAYNYFTYGS